MRILILELNPITRNRIKGDLEELGHIVDISVDINDFEFLIKNREYQLFIVNLFSIKSDYSYIKKLYMNNIPICITSVDLDSNAEIESLRNGAIEFIKMPYNKDVFILRCQNLIKEKNVITMNGLIINRIEKTITFNNKVVELHGKAFNLLFYLMTNYGRIASKPLLLNVLWEEPQFVTPNVIEVVINQIRQKVEKPFNLNVVETICGRGYRCSIKNK